MAGRSSEKRERAPSLHKCWKGLTRVQPLHLETSAASAASWKRMSYRPPSATMYMLKMNTSRKVVLSNLPKLIYCWANYQRAGSTVGLEDAWLEGTVRWCSLTPSALPFTEEITKTQTQKVTHSSLPVTNCVPRAYCGPERRRGSSFTKRGPAAQGGQVVTLKFRFPGPRCSSQGLPDRAVLEMLPAAGIPF